MPREGFRVRIPYQRCVIRRVAVFERVRHQKRAVEVDRGSRVRAMPILGGEDHEVVKVGMVEDEVRVLPHLGDPGARQEFVPHPVAGLRFGSLDVKRQGVAVVLDGVKPNVGVGELLGVVLNVAGDSGGPP